jgi:hypothetical protein
LCLPGLHERHRVLEFVLDKVAGRVPVIAHVSESGTAMAAAPSTAGSEPLKLSKSTRFLLATPQSSCDDRAFEEER